MPAPLAHDLSLGHAPLALPGLTIRVRLSRRFRVRFAVCRVLLWALGWVGGGVAELVDPDA